MKYNYKSIRFVLICSLTLIIARCSSDVDQRIEKAEFFLDKARYSEAEAVILPAVTAHPENQEAQFVYGQALLGLGALGEGGTYLSLLADLLNTKDPTNPLKTFTVVAPTATGIPKLQQARDIFIALTGTITDPSFLRYLYLQLYVARMFEIGGVVTQTGATSPDVKCNANGDTNTTDGIPDDFDPNGLDSLESARFQDNLANINGDGDHAGLPVDFGISDRINKMVTDLNAAGDLVQYLIDTYGDPTNPLLCS